MILKKLKICTILKHKKNCEKAHALQEAKTLQDLKSEEMKIEIVKRTRQIELQDQEILRREKELDATVKKPVSFNDRKHLFDFCMQAEAEKYRLEKIAEADKERAILEAEAEAESIRIQVLTENNIVP